MISRLRTPGSDVIAKQVKRTIKIIALILVVSGLVIACANIFNPGNYIQLPPVPLSEASYAKDGKGIIETVDFDVEWTPPISGTHYKSSIGTVVLKTGTFTSDADGFHFMTDPSTPTGEPYAVIGSTHSLKNYSVIMYDLDVSVSDGFTHQIGLRPVFANASGKNVVINSGLIRYQTGGFRRFNGAKFKTGIGNSFHYTFIVYPEGRVLVYVDGELLLNAEPYSMFTEECARLKGFRITLPCKSSSVPMSCTISNLNVSAFAPDYKGDIFELLDDEDLTLQECSDSILFNQN